MKNSVTPLIYNSSNYSFEYLWWRTILIFKPTHQEYMTLLNWTTWDWQQVPPLQSQPSTITIRGGEFAHIVQESLDELMGLNYWIAKCKRHWGRKWIMHCRYCSHAVPRSRCNTSVIPHGVRAQINQNINIVNFNGDRCLEAVAISLFPVQN